ncbi:hypothetical protein O1611_g9244 [Lasiodiplodia mahajangana]|uniref:Uncharacterized protein n=1 Tax=Lasiodiplodia mahajangana TaxID=1108764 RepID=A0ACC2JAI7_9PEZI|nr:hypothetical protein O1611_g9244 [Lasiodiplodia mahajangana]
MQPQTSRVQELRKAGGNTYTQRRFPTSREHRTQTNRILNINIYGITDRELWDGERAKVQTNGIVRILVRSDHAALQFYTSKSATARIKNSSDSATIRFDNSHVALMASGEVPVYQKSNGSLKVGKNGEIIDILGIAARTGS